MASPCGGLVPQSRPLGMTGTSAGDGTSTKVATVGVERCTGLQGEGRGLILAFLLLLFSALCLALYLNHIQTCNSPIKH